MVEHDSSKVGVASSNLVSCSMDAPVIGHISQEGIALHAEIVESAIVAYLRKASAAAYISDCRLTGPGGLVLLAPGGSGFAGFPAWTPAAPYDCLPWTACGICGQPWFEMYLDSHLYCDDCVRGTDDMVENIRAFYQIQAWLRKNI